MSVVTTVWQYNETALRDFLNVVFHVKHGTILTWAARGRPGYPVPADELLDHLPRVALSLYYGTSSAHAGGDGKFYNRRVLCDAMHVLVLDDIGTKIPEVPEALRAPTYVIETSEGNFQYGYVLAEPITDMTAATQFVRLMYNAGVSDSGGAMPNKLVRLPDGINGKNGSLWPVRLTHLNDNPADYWTPPELLEAAGVSEDWPATSFKVRAKSVTPWGQGHESSDASGLVDPVLAWLYEEGLVRQDGDGWVLIRCPWGDTHTTGDDTAGYMPVGREFPDQRAFNCFHEHCKDYNTRDFLLWVAANGGPEAPVFDRTAPLLLGWTYDPVTDSATSVFDPKVPRGTSVHLPALKRLYAGRTTVATMTGKMANRAMVDVWADSPFKTLTYGAMRDPRTNQPLVTVDGKVYVNQFRSPQFANLSPEEEAPHVERFVEFVEYLIPRDDEREFFLDWLAAKVRNQAFRGPAILMVTPTQGTGRTTLGHMVQMLLGEANTTSMTYDQLTGGSFNSFMLNTLVVCNEVYEGRSSGVTFYRNYERLKSLIDFQPTLTAINDKYRPVITVPVFTSFLLFSNHPDALPLDASDRRIYVLENAARPASPDYFTELNQWLSDPSWPSGVAQWLARRSVDVQGLLAPAAMTRTKRTLIYEAKSLLERCVDLCLERWQGPYISVAALETVLLSGSSNIATHLGIDMVKSLRGQLAHIVKRIAWKAPPDQRLRVRVHGDWGKVQHGICVLKTAPDEYRQQMDAGALDRNTVVAQIAANKLDDLQAYVFDNVGSEM